MNRKWPRARLTGGPHGKDGELRIDGKLIPNVSRAEVIFDVNDAVRLKTFQYVSAEVEWDYHSATHTKAVRVVVRARDEESDGDEIVILPDRSIAQSCADTVWEALYDCARQLELAGIAQGGTVRESSGRPPGH